MLYLKIYPIILATVLLVDGLWLGIIAKDFYRANIGHLMGDKVVWWAVALFYLVFAAGLILFAVVPGLQSGSWLHAALLGVALGLLCYAAYDLTNQALLKDWPVIITVADILWGGVISGIGATAGYFAAKLFGA